MSDDPVRLRYTGTQATTFREPGVGHVEPGGEFGVAPSRLPSFLRRPDIEHAGDCPWPPCRCALDPRPPREPDVTAKPAKAKAAKTSPAATD